jgi:hypothetical protein
MACPGFRAYGIKEFDMNNEMKPLTQDQLKRLGEIAREYQADTGKLPTTVSEITDHWYDLLAWASYEQRKNENSDLVGLDHMPECAWLAWFEKRSDAQALLAQALALVPPFAEDHPLPESFLRFRSLYRKQAPDR